MINIWLIHTLRIVHVVAASFWFGVAVMNTWFLTPSVRAAGPAGGAIMRELVQVRRLPVYVNTAALLTVLSGSALYWWRSAGFTGAWLATRSGLVFGVGGAVGIVAWAIGLFFIGRTVSRIGQLAAQAGAGGPPPASAQAEMQQAQSLLRRYSMTAAILLIVSALCMALGRYI